MPVCTSRRFISYRARPGFSLAELLVVVGIVSLLLSIIVPPLQLARRKAMQTHCAANLYEHGRALEDARGENRGFYPLWDDDGVPVRFTWIDVLIQRRYLNSVRSGYCQQDRSPDPLNEARGRALGLIYPRNPARSGIDYSYGIGVPLSAGGWAWRAGQGRPGEGTDRRFLSRESHIWGRVLAGDGNWSALYNLGGSALTSGIWNDPAWYDNTVAYRHQNYAANLLFQDGHVAAVRYQIGAAEPIDTNRTFLWYPTEPLTVGPESQHEDFAYPDTPPPSFQSQPPGDDFPAEMIPYFYTAQQSWTRIEHKSASTTRRGPSN